MPLITLQCMGKYNIFLNCIVRSTDYVLDYSAHLTKLITPEAAMSTTSNNKSGDCEFDCCHAYIIYIHALWYKGQAN